MYRRASLVICVAALLSCTAQRGVTAQNHTWPDDAWPTSSPAAEGIDPAAVDSLVASLGSGEYGLIDAFLLIRNGRVVANHRFSHDYAGLVKANGYDTTNHQYNYDHPDWHPYLRETDLHTLQSVTKSVSSAALGIAIDDGLIPGVNARAMPYFADYAPYTTDARKDSTTIEDFLTMRSGIKWTTTGGYSSQEHSTIKMELSDAWIDFVLDQPMDAAPGVRYQYNDGASVMLGKIVREATGKRMDAWAKERLFEPIGIREFHWKITPDGEADTEGGLYLAAEDLARIGYLFLRGGQWNGKQIVSRAWVEASTSPVVPDVNPANGTPDPGYGYQWWVTDQHDGQTDIFAANGYGGQFLLVVPRYDIVAVFNGWNIHPGARKSTYRALQNYILPAVDL